MFHPSFIYSTFIQHLGELHTGSQNAAQLCLDASKLSRQRGPPGPARPGPPHSLGKAGRRRCGCQSQNLLSGRGSWRGLDLRPGLARPPAVECVSAMCHRPRLWEKAAQLTSQQLPCARPGGAGKQELPAAGAPRALPSARFWPAPTLSQPTRRTLGGGLPLLGA